jgi:hypothetical protein
MIGFANDYGKYQLWGAIMGGYGSTRWGWHVPKDTVEASIGIKIADLQNLQKYAQIGASERVYSGSFSWQPSGASVSYLLIGQQLTLSYRMRRGQGDAWQDRQDIIRMEATRPHYGGRRWWFTCPICERRAGAVYLDRRRWRFCCRQCAGLVYRSQQAHDKTLDKYARMPWLADEVMDAARAAGKRASTAQLIAALKASEMQERLFWRDRHKRRGRR